MYMHTTDDMSRVKLPKSFVAINLSEKIPDEFTQRRTNGKGKEPVEAEQQGHDLESTLPPPALDG